MSLDSHGLRERVFRRIVAWSLRRPYRVLAAAGLIVVVALGLVAGRLELRTSNLDLIDPNLPTVHGFLDFAEDFGNPNTLVLVVDAEPESAAAAVDWLAPRLRALPTVRGVFDRLPHPPETYEVMGINPYLRSYDGRLHVLFVQPVDLSSSADAMAQLVESVRELTTALPESLSAVQVGLTGIPAYALDDRETIQRDVGRLSGIGAVLILVLFMAAFSDGRRPFAAVLALAVSVVATLGAAAIFPGHLTLLSAFFGSILFGLGIDFAVHLIDRAEHLQSHGSSMDQPDQPRKISLPQALRRVAVAAFDFINPVSDRSRFHLSRFIHPESSCYLSGSDQQVNKQEIAAGIHHGLQRLVWVGYQYSKYASDHSATTISSRFEYQPQFIRRAHPFRGS